MLLAGNFQPTLLAGTGVKHADSAESVPELPKKFALKHRHG